jgi:hypothetical protein
VFCFKRKGKHKIENGKEFPLPLPVSGSAHFSPFPRGLLLLLPPFFSARPTSRPSASRASPASSAPPPTSLQPLTSRPRAPFRCQVGPICRVLPLPRDGAGLRREIAPAARNLPPELLAPHVCPFKYSPRPSPSLLPNPRAARRFVLTENRRRDPGRSQSAAASRVCHREPLAGLLAALAKSPKLFFRVFVPSTRS